MEVSVLSAVNVSILAMGVIFIVLTILIFTIKVLVKLLPYEAPPAPQRRQKPASSENGNNNHDDHVAAITATLAMHMGKTPKEFKVVNIL